MPMHMHHHFGHHHGGWGGRRRPLGMIVDGTFHIFTLPYDIKRYRSKKIIAIFFFIMFGILVFDVGFEFEIGKISNASYLAPALVTIFSFILFYLLPFISIFAESMATCSHCTVSMSMMGGIGILLSHILTGVLTIRVSTPTYIGVSIFLGVLMFICNITYIILYIRSSNAGYFIEASKKLLDDLKNKPVLQVVVGQTVVDQYGRPLTIGQPQIQVNYPEQSFQQPIYQNGQMMMQNPQQMVNVNMAVPPIYNSPIQNQPNYAINQPMYNSPNMIATPMEPTITVKGKNI